MVKCATQGRFDLFDHAISCVTGLAVEHIERGMRGGGPWGVALVCRAAGIERGAYGAVLQAMSDSGRAVADAGANRAAVSAFVNLTRDGAIDALRRIALAD